MQQQDKQPDNHFDGSGYVGYAAPRLFVAALLIVAALAGGIVLLNHLDISPAHPMVAMDARPDDHAAEPVEPTEVEPTAGHEDTADAGHTVVQIVEPPDTEPTAVAPSEVSPANVAPETAQPEMSLAAPAPHRSPTGTAKTDPTMDAHSPQQERSQHRATAPPAPTVPPTPTVPKETPAHTPAPATTLPPAESEPKVGVQPEHPSEKPPVVHQPHGQGTAPAHTYRPPGIAFVNAMMDSIDYELNQRFWSWRPNDIVNVTDNVNNFQLGVLEVTRRTTVQLAERISRTGSTDAFNPHLENAMNWFMVKADRYWFPSPESKYRESLKELKAYKQDLSSGTATFYTRTDNLIPLLTAYEDLLGSCDENLVKNKEMDGSTVGFFKADDYFYYAKGVASTMANLLEAIHHDFAQTLESRNGSELLHHAIQSCRIASDLNPWFITNSDLDGLLANHRANMAAPISHARFYIGQLIKTLST